LVGVGIVLLLGVFIAIIAWGPGLLVDQRKASDDAYLKAITDNRTALIQAVGGFGVFLGVVVGFFTLRHNRQLLRASRLEHEESIQASRAALERTLESNRQSLERTLGVTERGQITDRFSKAIEQLGQGAADSLDLRLGGIYALEQIVRDSTAWHQPVVEVLAAFVRQHARGVPLPVGNTIADQLGALGYIGSKEKWVPLPIDVAAAVRVLSRRDRDKDQQRVDLVGVDFRRIDFSLTTRRFESTDFSYGQLQAAFLMFADLRKCYFISAQLQGATLRSSDLRGASFYLASLYGANLASANLEGADLAKADFESADLSEAVGLTIDQLKDAKISDTTKLPDYIDRAELLAAAAAPGPPTS
jgi:hypothetical protein